MHQMFLTLSVAFFLMTGCGGSREIDTDPVENNTNKPSNFAYKTQGRINVSLSIYSENTSTQKQILLYESQKTVNDPDTPGELTVFDGLLEEGVSDTNGKYETALTLGNHIESIWIVIPALAYQQKIDIVNNEIVLNITERS